MDGNNKIEATVKKQSTFKECKKEAKNFKDIQVILKKPPRKNRDVIDILRSKFKTSSNKENSSKLSSDTSSTPCSSDAKNSNRPLSEVPLSEQNQKDQSLIQTQSLASQQVLQFTSVKELDDSKKSGDAIETITKRYRIKL